MPNFSPNLEDASDDQLKQGINEHNPHFAQLESDELSRRVFLRLEDIISIFNKKSSEQTEKLIQLTWIIVGLTVVMVIGLIIQIVIALNLFPVIFL